MKRFKTKIKGLPITLGFIFAASFIGCETEPLNNSREALSIDEPVSSANGLVTLEWQGRQVRATKVGDVYMQDDIIFYPEDVTVITGDSGELNGVNTSGSAARTNRLWPDNIVHYAISPELPETNQSRVIGAIQHWEENTNLRFIERTNETAYVEFVPGSGCSSGIGRRGRRQTINLAPNCSLGSTIHEIGHTVGLYHEQSREDRDQWITVNYDNIQSGLENNFDKWSSSTTSGADLTPALDFGSIMMYNSFAFSVNREPTITRKDGSTYRVQRTALSEGDIFGINILYPGTETEEPETEEPSEPTTTTTPTTPTPTTPTPTTTSSSRSGDNVALGRPTSQSSTAFNGASSRAVDGNTNGVWRNGSITHTANTNQPWWRVDLDETTSIETVIIFNRVDTCCSNRLSNFYIDALNEDGEVIGSLFVSEPPSPSLSIRGNGIQAKSIRVRLDGTNPLSLAEVQVIKR